MTKFLNNADIKGYIAQTAVTSYLLKADSTGRLVAAIAGTDYQAPTTALLPSGGTAGQILAKIDGTNYNTQWIDNFAQQIKYDVKLGAALSKGTPVYVSSANGTNIIVSASSNSTEATSSKTLGLLETGGALNDIVKVVSDGLLSGLNTSAATIGDPVWLGANGALIFGLANKPSAPAHLVYIGAVTRVHAVNGEIFIKVQNGFELDELHNVALTSPSTGDGLFFETSFGVGLWKNKTIASVLGYTPANDSAVVHLAGTETITGVKTFSSVINASTLSLNGGTLAGNNIVSMRSNPTGGQFRIEKSDGSLSAYPFYIGVDGTALAYYYNAAGALKVLLHTNGTSYFGNSLSVGYATYAATSYSLDVNGSAQITSTLQVGGNLYGVGATFSNAVTAASIIKSGGTSSQFLKADGSVDSNAYITSSSLSAYLPLTGGTLTGDLTISGTNPRLYFTDTDNNPDYFISNTDGTFTVYDVTNSVGRFKIYTTGNAEFTNNLTAASFIKSGGTSAQFLKADGSVDSSTYLTSITSSQVTTALGYTPYNSTNPSGYITSSALSSYLPLSGGTLTGALSGTSATFSGAVTTASPLTIQATNPYIQWKDANAVRLGYIQHATNLVMAADSGNIVFNTTLASATVSAAGLTTLQFNDTSGNRTSGINVLAIQAENSNAPYNGFGGAIVFNNRAYTSGIVASTRIRSQINNNSVDSSGGSLIFEVTPTVGGTLTAALSINYNSQLRLNAYTTSSSFSGTAAGYLAFDSSGNVITVAGVAATDNTKLPLAGGTTTGIVTFGGSNNSTDNVRFQNTDGNYAYIRQTAASNSNNVWYDATLGATMWYAWDNPGSARTAGVYTQHIFGTGRGTSNEAVTINRGAISGTNSSGTTTYSISRDGSASLAGGITFTAPGGSILLKHAVSEVDAWIFQENATNWGLYWKNAPTGQHTFGGYTSVGAELVGMSAANASGNGILTSNFVGATTAYAQWMISNYTGYIWSASTIYAATSMVVGGNTVLHAGNYNSYSPTLTGGGASGTWGISISGNAATASNSSQLEGSSASYLFNNMNNVHGSYTDFNSPGNFGVRYMQGSTNGPGTGATQYYGFTLGLGSQYAFGTYGSQLYWNRVATGGNPYISVRFQEGGAWSSWSKIYAGYADSAGQVTINYNNDSNSTYQLLWGSGNSVYGTSQVYVNPSSDVIYARGGYVSPGNPWGTADSAYFPNGITTAGSTNWIYGTTYVGNAPGNGNGHQFWASGQEYHLSSNGTNSHGSTGRWVEKQSASGNFIPYSFESDYGNHSWGTVLRIRINQAGADRPSMQFSYAGTDNRWNVGYCYPDDQFRVTQNMAYRNDNSTSDGWGTERFRINTNGDTYAAIGGTLYANGNQVLTYAGGTLSNNYTFRSNLGGYLGSLSSPPLQVYSESNNSAFMSFHKGGYYAVNFGLDADNVMRIGGWSAAANRWQLDMSGNQTIAGDYYGNNHYANGHFRPSGDYGLYSQDYGGVFRRNTNSYGTWESVGYAKNGWGGYVNNNNYIVSWMLNTSGDFGFLTQNGNWWNLFYNNGNNCWGIGTDNTYSGDGFRCIKYGSSQYGWTTWSDRRAKENISNITGALDKVLNMRGVYFNYISDEAKNKRVGFIAQELEGVLPEAVRYAEEIDEYNVEYAQIVSVLAEATKEQQAIIVNQSTRIEQLELLVQQLINSNNGISN